jgi:hypothetical protein
MNLFPCIFLFLAAVATEGVPFEQNLRDAVAMKFMLQQHKVIFSISNRPQPSKDSSHYHRYQLVDDPSPVLASSPLVIGAYFNWTDLYVPVNVGTPGIPSILVGVSSFINHLAQHFTLLTYFFSGDSWLLDATAAVPPEDQFGNKKQIYLPRFVKSLSKI